LQKTVEEFLAEVQTLIDVASCDVADPGINGRVKITDLLWASDEATLTADLNLKTVHLPERKFMTNSHSDALVFFGATGDLAYKKIFPSLQAMVKTSTSQSPRGRRGQSWMDPSISFALERKTVRKTWRS